MKGSCKGWQKKWIGFSSSDGTSNDAIKRKLDHKQSAAGRVSSKIIFIQSSSEESNGLNDSSAQAEPSELNKMTMMTQPLKPRKNQNKRTNASGGGTKSKKTATAPVFKDEMTNPFGIVAIKQCLNHANQVPDFGPDVRIRMEINFCFPPPKTG